MQYIPINAPDNEWLLAKHFPDIIREPEPIPEAVPNACAINRARASLMTLFKTWYTPRVTYMQKNGWQKYADRLPIALWRLEHEKQLGR